MTNLSLQPQREHQHPHKDSTAAITPPKKLVNSSEPLICNFLFVT